MPAYILAEEGPQKGLRFDFEDKQKCVIGRDADVADVVLEDETVSRKHALIEKTEDGLSLKSLSRTNPTFLNDEEIFDTVLLQDGDRIQIGNTVFGFVDHEEIETSKSGYDDIFGDLHTAPDEPDLPPPPPRPEATIYDTIFEDTGPIEDLAFNLSAESPLILKVIGGPNAGAEIAIEKNKSYILGKDPSVCDIVFQDLSVSKKSAKLTINDDGSIQIEDLGSKNAVVINGSAITAPVQINPQDLVAIGTTVFMIIDREGPQETIYSPISSGMEAQKEPEEEPIITTKLERDWKKEPIETKYLLLAGSIFLIFLTVFISFFSLFKSKGVEIAVKDPSHEIKEALKKFENVQFSFNPASGKLFLVGHVLTAVDYQELKYNLNQLEFITSVDDTVIIDEGVWKMMNDIIQNDPAWQNVTLHCPQPGKFIISGIVGSSEDLNRLNEYLSRNFPYLDRLENVVLSEQILQQQITALIASKEIGSLNFTISGSEILLSGRYNEKMHDEYQNLIKELNHIKGISSVRSYAVASHPDKTGIDITSQYEVTGNATKDGKGFGVILNGKIYTIGDLVDGMKITRIETNTILLEKEGLKYKIDYTAGR